jgi:hypothetical protein
MVERRGAAVIIVDCWRLLTTAPSCARIISVGRH